MGVLRKLLAAITIAAMMAPAVCYASEFVPEAGDSLTPEQEEAGWVIVDGYIYPPADVLADGAETSEVQDTDKCGYVTFKANVPLDVETDCYVEITNILNYNIYEFNLPLSNEFATTRKVPAGKYIVSGGGPEMDYASNYTISKVTFSIGENETEYVELNIQKRESRDVEAEENGIEVPEAGEEIGGVEALVQYYNNSGPVENSASGIKNVIIEAAIIIIAAVAAGIFFWRKFRDR